MLFLGRVYRELLLLGILPKFTTSPCFSFVTTGFSCSFVETLPRTNPPIFFFVSSAEGSLTIKVKKSLQMYDYQN